ncbi:MAG TPA: hypothetical protein VK050_05705 [Flavobacteriaceae bacterium]|nr:hypothetical protein [Flavobacteriaceae bacterium]
MKPFKYFIFFLLIIFGISKSHAQMYRFSNTNPFWKGEVKLTDGEIIEGLIQVPYKSSQRRVAYKIDEDADRQILKAEDVDAIYLTSSTGYQYLFERVDVYNTMKQNRSYGKKDLLLVSRKNNHATLYIMHGTIEVNHKEDKIDLVYYYHQGRDVPMTTYYIRKNNVEHAYLLGTSIKITNFRNRIAFHLNEVPSLVEKVKNRELRQKHLEEIIDIYFKETENM